MRVRLRFERVYGSASRFGDNPRDSPPGSPIVLDDYPLPGERLSVYLGAPVDELDRTNDVACVGGFTLVRRNVIRDGLTVEDERAELARVDCRGQEGLGSGRFGCTWYITILIERTINIPDEECEPDRWFSIPPRIALRAERDLLQYGAEQTAFVVDHLSSFIPRHFFAAQDGDDRVVFLPETGPPFRCPQATLGGVTASTSSPLDRCDVEGMRTALSNLRNEGQLALAPLTPPTLVTLVERATISDLKGRALEELVAKLFLTIPGLQVMSRVRTATEEIDIGIFNDTATGFLASEGAVILAECKNWSGKCGRDEFSLLEKKAENRRERCTLGFLISWNGFAGTIDKELLRSSRQRLVIVPLTGDDLKRAVRDNSFFEVIQSVWRDVVFT